MFAAETVIAISELVLPFRPMSSILGAGNVPDEACTITHTILDVSAPVLRATG